MAGTNAKDDNSQPGPSAAFVPLTSPEMLVAAVAAASPKIDMAKDTAPSELKKSYEVLTPALKGIATALSAPGYPGMDAAVAAMGKPEVVEAINKINEYEAKVQGVGK